MPQVEILQQDIKTHGEEIGEGGIRTRGKL